MAEKAKSRGAGSKSRRDKSRAQSRQTKKPSSKSPGRTSAPSPADDGGGTPPEPLDPGPILDELLDRVMTECALAAAARQRVPFAVLRARDAILFVAEWRFQVRDEGEPDPGGEPDPERDGVWSEDEEPQTCTWDSWTPGVVPVMDVPLPWVQVPVTAEAGGPPERPGEVPDRIPVPAAFPGQVYDEEPPCQEPSAATEALPSQVPDAGSVPAMPGPPSPEPPTAPQVPGKGRRLSRPSRPRLAPLGPAPLPAKTPQRPGQGPQEPREAPAEDGGRVPPVPSSARSSLASVQPLRPSRGAPRLGARRLAARWVMPEVKVVGLRREGDWAWPGGSRARLPPSGSRVVLPGPRRPPRIEPQLFDPWLASARLAPGVTVRWGDCERRGPAMTGYGGTGNREQQEKEAARRVEQELKPILSYPECRLSEYE